MEFHPDAVPKDQQSGRAIDHPVGILKLRANPEPYVGAMYIVFSEL
jgi:hypothetical protein